jgi:hypothetical protein
VDGAVRVVDAVTGLTLSRIDVVLAQGAEDSSSCRRGENESESAGSAVFARGDAGSSWARDVLAGSSGYAWRASRTPARMGGTPVHALEKGGALTLHRVGSTGPEASVFVSLIQHCSRRRCRGAVRQDGSGRRRGRDVRRPSPGDVLARFSCSPGTRRSSSSTRRACGSRRERIPTLELGSRASLDAGGYASLDLLLDVRAETDSRPTRSRSSVALQKRPLRNASRLAC